MKKKLLFLSLIVAVFFNPAMTMEPLKKKVKLSDNHEVTGPNGIKLYGVWISQDVLIYSIFPYLTLLSIKNLRPGSKLINQFCLLHFKKYKQDINFTIKEKLHVDESTYKVDTEFMKFATKFHSLLLLFQDKHYKRDPRLHFPSKEFSNIHTIYLHRITIEKLHAPPSTTDSHITRLILNNIVNLSFINIKTEFPTIKELILANNIIPLKTLQNLPEIKILRLNYSNIDKPLLNENKLLEMPISLRQLDVNKMSLSQQLIDSISPSLRCLYLNKIINLPRKSTFETLTNLTHVTIKNTEIYPEHFKTLPFTIKELKLTDIDLKQLSKAFNDLLERCKLEKLKIKKCENFYPELLKYINRDIKKICIFLYTTNILEIPDEILNRFDYKENFDIGLFAISQYA